MEVREVAGECGAMRHIVPTVWQADDGTLCVLLDNPRTGRWIVITIDVKSEVAGTAPAQEREVA